MKNILTTDGIKANHITFNKIKKLDLDYKKEIIKKCLDIDSKYFNESNVVKVYASLFYSLEHGKFSGKDQNIFTMASGKKYHIEIDGGYGKELPKWLILYPKNKNDKIIEINLDEVNQKLFQ